MDNFKEETSETRVDEVSDESTTRVDQHDEASGEKTNEPIRRSTRICKEPKWFSTNAMHRTFTADERSLQEALQGKDKEAWRKAIKRKSVLSRKWDVRK